MQILTLKDDNGFNALIHTSWDGKIEVVKFLVERCADSGAKNNNGKTFFVFFKRGIQRGN